MLHYDVIRHSNIFYRITGILQQHIHLNGNLKNAEISDIEPIIA
jgi:hypothetical protein